MRWIYRVKKLFAVILSLYKIRDQRVKCQNQFYKVRKNTLKYTID